MIEDPHADVASYALGILDRVGVERFEDHLVTCDRCAMQLEDLIPVSRLLAGVDREAVLAARRSLDNGQMLHSMRGVVSSERRRARWRQLGVLGAAASVAAIALLGWSTANPPTVNVGDGPPSPAPVASATLGADSTGGRTTTRPPGTRYQNTDSSTGTTLEVYVDGEPWGSRMTVTLSKIKGPLTCTLVAVGRDGSVTPGATWSVSPEGYGTPAHSGPLTLTAATSTMVDNLARIEVRGVTPQGVGYTLVSVPL